MPPSTGDAGGTRTTCATCGRPAVAGRPCPRCGVRPEGIAAELAKLDHALSEMAAETVALEKKRQSLASRMQAAKHQRDVLARELATRAADRPRRRMPGPRQPADRTPPARLRTRPPVGPRARTRIAAPPEPATEASSGSVQALMLGLGALLLGIAAVVFVGVAITVLDVWGQLAILVAATVVALALPLPLARGGLISTAETVSAVGLVLVSVVGYALWATGTVAALPVQTFAGLVAAGTAAAGYGYHRLTGLAAARSAGLLAVQPVLPLLAYPAISHPAGWAAVFALLALANAGLGRLDRTWSALADWQRYLAWVLHGLALGAAAGYAATALALATTPAEAVRGGSVLVATAGVGVLGALTLRRDPLPDVAGGLMTISVIVAAARVAMVAATPDRTLLLVSVVVAAAGWAGRILPEAARRGPQVASAVALVLMGTLVTGLVARAGAAAVVLPPWPPEPSVAAQVLPAGTAGWQLATTTAVLTFAAVVALPPAVRREGAVAGVALTAVAAPTSFGLSPTTAAWVLVLVTAGVTLTAAGAPHRRGAAVHLAAAAAVATVAVGIALAAPALTAAILGAVTVIAAVGAAPRPGADRCPVTGTVSRWSAAAAVLTLPAATATTAAAAGASTSAVLALGAAGACGSLAYAVRVLLIERVVAAQVTIAAATPVAALVAVGLLAPDATAVDVAVSLLLLGAAALIYFTPRIDATRRRDRLLDGADFAAAAVTAGVVVTLARLAWLALPLATADAALTVVGLLVAVVAVGVRATSARTRRGAVLGVGLAGALVASLAAAAALSTAVRALAQLWAEPPAPWPPPPEELTWGAPATLAVLAVAAAVVLPPPTGRLPGAPHVSAALAVLATVGAPVALGLDRWGPAVFAVAVGTGYAAAATGLGRWRPVSPPSARAHGGAAAALGLYAVAAALPRPASLALVLAAVVVVGTAVAGLIATLPRLRADPRQGVGGAATTAVLLALPGMLAALAVVRETTPGVAFLAALAGTGLGLAVLALLTTARHPGGPPFGGAVRAYLPYGTVGVAAGATGVALFAMPTPYPSGVYAAAAVLLGVVAELLRADPTGRDGLPSARPVAGWVNPSIGALLAAAVPATIALIQMAPALHAALIVPLEVLADPWGTPPPRLLVTGDVPATSALAALLLTLAAALAAAGFGGAVTRQTAPVVAPGLAVTLLISPAALGLPWPAGTVAALAVFTVSMLGVALTPPPRSGIRTRVLRWARGVVLVIGLAAGGAGLAGSFADRMLTWGTFGGAVAVGATAALGGRTRSARLLGWLGAALAAQTFALTSALLVGAPRHGMGLFLLPVAATALVGVARLPRLRALASRPELTTVEWVGGYLTLLLAGGIAYGSRPDLAAVLIGAGLVLGGDALRGDRPDPWRRALLWAAVLAETGGIWIMIWLAGVRLLEAYTLPLAALALVAGLLELRRHPQMSSWVVTGPAIIAALAPSLVAAVASMQAQPLRQGWVLLGGVAVLLFGSRRRQRAPVILGSAIAALGALHLLSLAGPWLVLIPTGILLLYLGGNYERKRRDLARIRGALDRMR